MKIDTELIQNVSGISTTISALIAVATLMSAYSLYKKNRRDTKIGLFRQTICGVQLDFEGLNYMYNHELFHDISRSIVFSTETKLMLKSIQAQYIKADSSIKINDDKRTQFVKDNTPSITNPIMSKISVDYTSTTSHIGNMLIMIKEEFPILFLIANLARQIFMLMLTNLKRVISTDDTWERMISSILKDKDGHISVADFQFEIHNMFVGIMSRHAREEGHQALIDSFLNIVNIIVRCYQNLSDNELLNQSRREKKLIGMINIEDRRPFELLTDVEPALSYLFKKDDLLNYHGEVCVIKARYASTSNDEQ